MTMGKGVYERTRRPLADRFWEKVEKRGEGDCWPWKAGTDRAGYGVFWVNELGKSAKASRMAIELTTGPIPPGLWALHHCDNPACVNPNHLYLGTALDNQRDMIQRGRQNRERRNRTGFARGERLHCAKLTEDQVREIRSIYEAGAMSLGRLAMKYATTKQTIWRVVRKRVWRHVA